MIAPSRVIALVDQHMSGPLVRGVRDCCTQPCAIFGELFGRNPLGPVAYRTTKEALRFVLQRGGAEKCAQGIASAAGLIEVAPSPGCIGRIHAANSELDLTLAICVDGKTWAAKSHNGYQIMSEFIVCWGPSWD